VCGNLIIGAAGCLGMSSKTEVVDLFELAKKRIASHPLTSSKSCIEFGEAIASRYLQVLRQQVQQKSLSLVPADNEVIYELCVFRLNQTNNELLLVKSMSAVSFPKGRNTKEVVR